MSRTLKPQELAVKFERQRPILVDGNTYHSTADNTPMNAVPRPFATAIRLMAVAIAVATAAPSLVQAQAPAQIFSPAELTVMPKLASPSEVARIVRESYPDQLRRAGINGTVEVEFVVGADGRVEGNSVEVIAASPPALGSAAKNAVGKFTFKPGQVKGQPVRTRVAIPLVYKAS
jgi:TonB family protein